MTVDWLVNVFPDIESHLVTYGMNIDAYLPTDLYGDLDLRSRALVVTKEDIRDIECVVRGYLTGSGWKAYQKDNGVVCGIQLPPGLHDGSKLPEPIFTPTTKAEDGNDKPLDEAEVIKEHGTWVKEVSLKIYTRARDFALAKGIIIADTKLELSSKRLCDEVFTPDSSRFWLELDWMEASKVQKSPPGQDKQPVREWGKTIETPFFDDDGNKITGINNLDAENPDHIRFVHGLTVPENVLKSTTSRYQGIQILLAA